MHLVDNGAFFQRLKALFESANKRGHSVWLTHKRYTYDSEDASMKRPQGEDDTKEYPCLIRVADGKDITVSTLVEAAQLDRFHDQYGSLLKASMSSLRKRDKKREKERAEKAAAHKKRTLMPIIVKGPKRGPGRKKRGRLIKAALKQEEARIKFEEREAKAKERAKVSGTVP